MKITKLKMYKDGGTVEIITEDSSFCFDNRIGTKTKYQLYDGYPNDDNSNLTTPEYLFFKTELNLKNKTWRIITPSIFLNGAINAKEIINNNLYINRINNTYDKFNSLAQKNTQSKRRFQFITTTHDKRSWPGGHAPPEYPATPQDVDRS